MDIYVAIKRIRFDVDEVIGVFSDRDKAENEIVQYIMVAKKAQTTEEYLFTSGASWEVDVWTVDTNTKKENYGLTSGMLLEEINKVESA